MNPAFPFNRLPLRVGILMDHPSPHMSDFLDALARRDDLAAAVVYFNAGDLQRAWGDPPGELPYQIVAQQSGALRGAMARLRVDLWVVNTVYTAPQTLAAIAWLTHRRIPWVYMNEPIRPRGPLADRFKRQFLRFLLRSASGILGAGRNGRARYQPLLHPGQWSESIPYYVDLDDFRCQPLPQPPAAGTPVRFVSCGKFSQGKGLDILLEAVRRLPPEGWHLTLAGTGPLETRFRAAFASAFPHNQVTFLGAVPYAERLRIFAGNHVFVFPSRWDGWGMVLPEAMATGLPAIASDHVGSAHEFIREGTNGFIVPVNNPMALADRMATFIRNPASIGPMAAAARAALAEYRPELGAARFVEILAQAIPPVPSCHGRLARSQQGQEAPAVDTAIHPAPSSAPPLTWAAIVPPEPPSARLRRLARKAVISLSTALGRHVHASGHRVLVYHLVLKQDRQGFHDHLDFLSQHYRLSSLPELLADLQHPADDSTPRLAITFDDAFRVLIEHALDALAHLRLPAAFFVPTGFVQSRTPEEWARYSLRAHYYSRPLEPMTPEDLRTLTRAGHTIGSHGVTHTSLDMRSLHQVRTELHESSLAIRDWTGIAPCHYAYPYGDTATTGPQAPAIHPLLQESGYTHAFTLRRGALTPSSPPFLLPRDHVEGNWRVRDLRFFLLSRNTNSG